MSKKHKKKDQVYNSLGAWVDAAINERLAKYEEKGEEIKSVYITPSTNVTKTEKGYEVWMKIVFDKTEACD